MKRRPRGLRALVDAQEWVAGRLAGDGGVRIEWGDRGPSVDLDARVIYLPRLPRDVDVATLEVVRGWADHEAAHVAYTDPEAFRGLDEATFGVANGIEDSRINKLLGAAYEGCKVNLDRAVTHALAARREGPEHSADERRFEDAIAALCLIAYDRPRADAVALVGADPSVDALLDEVADILDRLPGLTTSREVRETAELIVERWRKHGGTSLRRAARRAVASSIGPALGRRIARELGGRGDTKPRYSACTAGDVVVEVPRKLDLRTVEIETDARAATSALRRLLAAELGGRAPAQRRGLKSGPRLDGRSLARVAVDDGRIHTRRARIESRSVAVSLALDFSGSMSRRGGLDVAVRLGMAFAKICETLGIACEVLGFTTASWERRPCTHGHVRRTPLAHLVIKPFGASLAACRHAFAHATDVLCAHNVDGESILWAARRLAVRREDVHLLAVLSDGEPESADDFVALGAHLEETVERLDAAGIRVLAIGIKSRSAAHFYPHHVICDSVDDVVGTGYAELVRVMRAAMTAR